MNNQEDHNKTDVSISFARTNLFGFRLIPILATLVLLPYMLIWRDLRVNVGLSFLITLLVSVPVHEVLHGLGFM